MVEYLGGYAVLINIVAYLVMWLDKSYARRRKWRISEKTLFALVLAGGGIGMYCSMYVNHHKTKHHQFVYGIPLIIAAQVGILFWILL